MLFFLLLTDKQAKNDQYDANPFATRQDFSKEKKHPKSRKGRTDIIERIGLRHAYLSQGITEQNKCRHACKNGQIPYAPKRRYKLVIVHCP